jgi:AcrR family transcriptional regulator
MKRAIEDGPADGPRAWEGTPRAILQAALRVLARDGYGGLTARAVAAEAGTNLALLNYYFGSKERMLLEVFDLLDAQRLDRQRRMYAAPDQPLSAKWRQAAAFYRADLADGYVRVLQELTALGYARPRVAARVRQTRSVWRALLEEVAAAYLPALGIALPPAWVASAVASFWLGMETQHLLGARGEDGHYFAILDFVGDWLERREQAAAAAADGAGRPPPGAG